MRNEADHRLRTETEARMPSGLDDRITPIWVMFYFYLDNLLTLF